MPSAFITPNIRPERGGSFCGQAGLRTICAIKKRHFEIGVVFIKNLCLFHSNLALSKDKLPQKLNMAFLTVFTVKTHKLRDCKWRQGTSQGKPKPGRDWKWNRIRPTTVPVAIYVSWYVYSRKSWPRLCRCKKGSFLHNFRPMCHS